MSLFQQININGVSLTNLQAAPNSVFANQFSHLNQMNIQVHPEMRGALPELAAYIYNHIAQRAQQNLSRAVHFNMLIANGNGELLTLLTLIANMVYFKVKSGAFQNLNQAVQSCTEYAVTRRVNYITINIPDLLNKFQDSQAVIQNLAQEYVNESQQVLNEMSQTYMGGASGFGNGQQQQQQNNGGFNGGFAVSGFGGNNQNNNSGGFSGVAVSGFGQARSNGGGASSVIVRTQDNGVPRGDRFNNDLGMGGVPEQTQQVETRQVQNQPETAPSVMEQMNRGLNPAEQVAVQKAAEPIQYFDDRGNLIFKNLPEVKAPWTPSIYQTHPLMFDRRKFDINRRGFEHQGTNYVIDTLRKPEVDRSAHSLPSAAQFMNKITPANTTRDEFKEKSLIHASSMVATVRNLDVEAEFIERAGELRDNGYIVISNPVNSLEEVLSLSRQTAMLNSKHEFGAFVTEFMHAKEFVVTKEDAKDLIELSKIRTIPTLVDEMTAIIQDPKSTHSLRVAVVQLNRYLAECWLEWIRFYLCLDEFTGSDSFIDDVLNIREDIGGIAGIPYRKMLDSNQQRFIQTYMAFGEPLEPSMVDIVEDGSRAEVKNERDIVVVPILTPSILISTEFLESEFGFQSSAELDGRDVGCGFDDVTISPAFRQLVQTVLEKPTSMGLQGRIRRSYISTLDNIVYEVAMGLGEVAPLLIKKVKTA